MFFVWLKKYMPRGLYSRAALILLVPVVALQLVVLVAFSQRYFNDVTQQLMRGVVAEVGLYVSGVNGLPDDTVRLALSDLDSRLGFESQIARGANDMETGPILAPVQTLRPWYDVSGRTIIATLEERIEGIEGIDLASEPRDVILSVMTDKGRLRLALPRVRASADNPHQLILVTLVTGIVMSLVAAIFLRNQMRPIRRLALAAEAFGRGRVVPYRPAGAVEVRAAGAAFLDMRARIDRHIEQRTLILSGVSHDLRTPLTRMKLSLSMLESEPELSPSVVKDIAEMQADIGEMEQLLDEFLAFARADALDDLVQVDPAEILRGAMVRGQRGGGAVALADLPADVPMISARPHALSRALDNLVGNALRYGQQARLSLAVHDRSVVFTVEDDGPGISDADREKAMQPFVRLDAARNQNHGSGVGLGLAITIDIARKHGGTLRLGKSADLGGLKADLVIAR